MRRRDVLLVGAAGTVGYGGYRWLQGGRGEEGDSSGIGLTGPTDTPGSTPNGAGVTNPPRVGGTLNGRPRRLQGHLGLIDQSNTSWLHAFLNPLKKLSNDVSPEKDPDIRVLRQAVQEKGVNLIVSLRWNFSGYKGANEPENVPETGSDREATLFEYATKQLRAIGEPVAFVVLGNEPLFETDDEDLGGEDSPLVQFTRRLKTHLMDQYVGDGTRLLVGSFNKLYSQDFWKAHAMHTYRALFEMARTDDDIDGIDVHIHYEKFEEAEKMLDIARRQVSDGTITATEFSPIWRYEKHVDKQIGSFDGGHQFLDRHELPDGMTVVEYYEHAKESPRPRDEMADFMETMHWYNVHLVRDMHDLLASYDVDLGTIGFMVDEGVTNVTWDEDWRPFQINHLFQGPFIDGANGAHPHYIDGYHNRA